MPPTNVMHRFFLLLGVLTTVAATAAPPEGDFAAAKREAQVASRSADQGRRRAALEHLATFPTEESIDLIIRVGLKAKDEATRSAARRVLARMAGAASIEAGASADGDDPAGAAAPAVGAPGPAEEVRDILRNRLTRELKSSTSPGPVAVGLATALTAAEGDEAAEGIAARLDDGSLPQGAALAWAVATVSAADGPAGVPVLMTLSRLRSFASDFSFRRGVVRGLIAIHEPASVSALIGLLGSLRGEVRADVAGYLTAISGERFGVDTDAWRAWWDRERPHFVFPPRQDSYPPPAVAPGDAGNAYYEIPVLAERIVFVIDTSSSMEGARMETARRELVSAIHALEPGTMFTVVAFSDTARSWQPQLVEAGDESKRAAAGFVRGLVAAGKTASFDALDAAFRYDAEAIFFLSDGEPTAGRMVNPAQIVRFVAEANRNRRLSLHTIGIMPDAGLAAFLQSLATANNGAYRHVAE